MCNKLLITLLKVHGYAPALPFAIELKFTTMQSSWKYIFHVSPESFRLKKYTFFLREASVMPKRYSLLRN